MSPGPRTGPLLWPGIWQAILSAFLHIQQSLQHVGLFVIEQPVRRHREMVGLKEGFEPGAVPPPEWGRAKFSPKARFSPVTALSFAPALAYGKTESRHMSTDHCCRGFRFSRHVRTLSFPDQTA